jgi:hypothetical protein
MVRGFIFPNFYIYNFLGEKFPPKINAYVTTRILIRKLKISKNCPKCFDKKPTIFVLIKYTVSCGCHILTRFQPVFLTDPLPGPLVVLSVPPAKLIDGGRRS